MSSLTHLSSHFNRAVHFAEVNTVGYKANTKEFFKGFLSKRINFVSATLDSAVKLIGALALTVVSGLTALATNGLDIIGNMARLRHPLTNLKFQKDAHRCKNVAQLTIMHGISTLISLVGVVAPMGAVKIDDYLRS